jgi:hypothetical protein
MPTVCKVSCHRRFACRQYLHLEIRNPELRGLRAYADIYSGRVPESGYLRQSQPTFDSMGVIADPM